ncbi:MAG: hypothetical protein MJB14_10930, partial [Spirochaetes bacterium]|nr:hypothetical protein [Spirochaetota bacterium]
LLADLAPSLSSLMDEVADLPGSTAGNTTTYANVPTDSGTKSIAITTDSPATGDTTVQTTINDLDDSFEDEDSGSMVTCLVDLDITTIYYADGSIGITTTMVETIDGTDYTTLFDFTIDADGITLSGTVTIDGVEISITEYMDELSDSSEPVTSDSLFEEVVMEALYNADCEFWSVYTDMDIIAAGGNLTHTAAAFEVSVSNYQDFNEVWTCAFSNYDVYGDGVYILETVGANIITCDFIAGIISGRVHINGTAVDIYIDLGSDMPPATMEEAVKNSVADAIVQFDMNVPSPIATVDFFSGFGVDITVYNYGDMANEYWEFTYANQDIMGDGSFVLNSPGGEILTFNTSTNMITGSIYINGTLESISTNGW